MCHELERFVFFGEIGINQIDGKLELVSETGLLCLIA